jgi:hypothetical protein
MLIYKTLGDDAQSQFAQTWGVGCVTNARALALTRRRVV